MQTRKFFTVLALIAALIMAGCTAGGGPSISLNGTSWALVTLNDKPALPNTPVTLTIQNNNIGGSDGCNSYSTSFTVNGDKISLNKTIVTTMRACQDAVMLQETAYLKALTDTAAYKMVGQQLTLLDASGKTLAVFSMHNNPSIGTPIPVNTVAIAVGTAVPGAVGAGGTGSGGAVGEPIQPAQTSASIAPALPNAEYPLELTSTGKAQLKDGLFEEPAAPGSAAKLTVQLGKDQAFGDINGDGSQDAAVTLVVDPGGSGTFTYLALVLNENGTAKPIASVLLGDRIVVKSLVVDPETIVVTMLTRKADESMSAQPTLEVTRTFKLQGDKLVEVQQ